MARYRRSARILRTLGAEKAIHATLGAIYAVDTEQPLFHLTFDDGPHPEVTPAVLAALAESEAHATFFVLTSLAEAYPEIIEETLGRGHTIALHTRTHPRLSDLSFKRLLDEIPAAKRDLEKVTGSPIRWFRAPYGSEGIRSIPVIRSAGLRSLVWSADTHDWKGLSAGDELNNASKNVRAGGIALLHDVPASESTSEDESRGYMSKAELTRRLIDVIRSRGLEPVGLDQLLRSGRPLRRAKLA